MTDETLKDAIETEFDASDLAALRSYCARVGITFSKNHNAATLRKMLLKATAEGSGHYAEVEDDDDGMLTEDNRRLAALELTQLSLRSQAGWQGRRRKIVLHRSMDHESTRPQFFAWGRLHCYVPMGVEVNIPYPIFNILKLTSGSKMKRKRMTDDEGRIYFKDEWIPSTRFMYSDMGDDPETANLPRDIADMAKELHALTNGFDRYSDRQLREVCSRLGVHPKPDWDSVELMSVIETKCGLAARRVDLSTPDIAAPAG